MYNNLGDYGFGTGYNMRRIDYAYQLLAEKKWEEADAVLDHILEDNPNNANALAAKKLLTRELRNEQKAQKPPSALQLRRAERRAKRRMSYERRKEKKREMEELAHIKKLARLKMKEAKKAEKLRKREELDAVKHSDGEPERPHREKKVRLTAAIAAAVVIVGIIAAVVLFDGGEKEPGPQTPEQTAATTLTDNTK